MDTVTDIRRMLTIQKNIGKINDELKEKGIFDIDYLLINNSPEEVMDLVGNTSVIFNVLRTETFDNGQDFELFFFSYLVNAKEELEKLFIDKDDDDLARRYHKKLNEPITANGQFITYAKGSIGMTPDDVNNTLKLMKEAIVAYYKVYYNKYLLAELTSKNPGDKEYFKFQIRERELLHLLGVNANQLKNNPDFIRLTGRRNMNSLDILEWIIKDIDGNNDLSQFYEDSIKKRKSVNRNGKALIVEENNNILNSHYRSLFDRVVREKFELYNSQYKDKDTTSRLLNYHKVRTKSQAFMKYGPFEKVSAVSKLSPYGQKLAYKSNSNFVILSKAECFNLYPWAFFGSVQTPDSKYIETLVIDSAQEKNQILRGSKPAIIKGVYRVEDEDVGGGIPDKKINEFVEPSSSGPQEGGDSISSSGGSFSGSNIGGGYSSGGTSSNGGNNGSSGNKNSSNYRIFSREEQYNLFLDMYKSFPNMDYDDLISYFNSIESGNLSPDYSGSDKSGPKR